ncbi:hypothetical protein OSB04_010055 [Centaurea solstitialis]|uniref:Methyltransferase n=1 Tax=Centaurea solstitialis TaxID=347529 RepID=A0AA38WNY7_9ASTR|nr:hypothetical protein OSB04_010055 [Centaurea solstitialis]
MTKPSPASPPPPPPPPSSPPQNPLRNPLIRLLSISILCSISYTIGSYTSAINTYTTTNHLHQPPPCPDPTPISTTSHRQNPPPKTLDFEPHNTLPLPPSNPPKKFKTCPANFTHYCPCQDPLREVRFRVEKMLHRERHCPVAGEILRCLVPKPAGYKWPFPWPKSRGEAWFSNVPFKRLTESKKQQNWVRLKGVKGYVGLLKKLVPLQTGAIRTALDTGCGVASFGDSLMDYNILTMSIAPRDIHEAQVQFALERGLPAMLGVLGTYRLPYPSRSFDMAHCSRCLVPWTEFDGLYLMEIDRLLRPGGYWVLSGPPINWKVNYVVSNGTTKDPKKELRRLEDLARRLCWKKISGKGPIAVWQKPNDHLHCDQTRKDSKSPKFCGVDDDPDDGWYRKMDSCITPLPKEGGILDNWPKRLNSIPPRMGKPNELSISHSKAGSGLGEKDFLDDTLLWKRRVSGYIRVIKSPATGGYRNIMDMNAGLGGFAASLSEYPVWVMNVVPHDADHRTLGIIYERGLIGTYMNWCEPFSTYPRSYDLIHADNVFSLYKNKCDIMDIFIEMYRILRPKGTIIIADHVDIIVKMKRHIDQMGWHSKLSDTEAGPFGPRKLLFVDI